MIDSSSSFIVSSIPLLHNAVKSVIFKVSELLMAFFALKFLSLVAARSSQFTSYLMFSEDYIQRWFFFSSRGLSRAGVIVLLFSILHALASLYGTLLWALDSPGYIFKKTNATVAEYGNLRKTDPPYIVQLHLGRGNLKSTEESLAQIVGSELFKPGLNYTLTGDVQRGAPETVAPTRQHEVGARIWLDSDGFSVSADSAAMIPNVWAGGPEFPLCIYYRERSMAWNCTFNNTFSLAMVQRVIGKPEVHWDDKSDLKLDSRYVKPNRVDNIWASFGAGGGSATMTQVFTVTKGKRRHTFVESVLRATMLTKMGAPFAVQEVKDLVRRTASTNETERNNPVLGRIVGDIMSAQAQNLSYQFGFNSVDNGNLTVFQSNWAYFTAANFNSGEDLYSLISLTSTNITLIRSETMDSPPTPFEGCDNGWFQNEAFGGRVTQTDCAAPKLDTNSTGFLGQVDTAAVLITYGLGSGRSNVSSESLDDTIMSWIWNTSATIEGLLVARGYAVSVDPTLVSITVDKLIVAMSGLQLLLSILSVVLAGAAWVLLGTFAPAPWSNTFLSSLLHSISEQSGVKSKAGYMVNPPSVELSTGAHGGVITVSGNAIVLQGSDVVPMDPRCIGAQDEHSQMQSSDV
ncbi:hypothetical protein VFPPC_16717 [Pochonia chlamydosporia 170]|uniref:Uncharacterized protein n=1 Tax=Pochonia chlamydosporia 170 TaxID=1380566 RepID=A0A179F7T2_METCM|nr:hypothetical protein VFPPC_16717 [Pochonia chlamydosporia 170]OAQ61223.1 hypothetical protein VFPPC_16717 [Pochonia chlamydosporia 170]